MYLKEIVATGFKSFADKISIKLDNDTTCIVGPNGSGKSNVVDAVRWVLGEQSVKSLRGDNQMSDIIFAGSKNRKALNMASVELIFDNSDHYLNLDYTDISIKRKAYRTGENEYYLNNQKCRLKDILSLMLDTGIGRDSFNIISQGEVDKILSHSSYDRRVIIEEVAGVLKYKKRKEEALKRLDRTHDNMSRVKDIISELESQVIPLREQSSKAQEYLDNKKKLEDLEIALLAYDIYNDSMQLDELKKKKDEYENIIMDLNNSTITSDNSILEKNVMKDKLESRISSLNQELLSTVTEVERLNSEKLLLEEKERNKANKNQQESRMQELIEEKERLASSISTLKGQIELENSTLAVLNKRLSEIDKNRLDNGSRKDILMSEFSKVDQELISLSHKEMALKNELDSSSNIPRSVSSVLNNDKLVGIYDIIGNILSADKRYVKALEVAISSSRNFIITKDEEASKAAINYLKEKRLGRATFFPLSVIKSRTIDNNTLVILGNCYGFIDVLSNLVTYDEKYKNIIENQLGMVLVCDNIDNAILIARKINYKYKIVTLDGDVLNVGGSLTGGSSNNYSRSNVTIKQEITFIKEKITSLQEDKKSKQDLISSLDSEISRLDDNYLALSHDVVNLKEKISSLANSLDSFKIDFDFKNNEINSLNLVVNNSAISMIEEITKKYYDKISHRDILKSDIDKATMEVSRLKDELEEMSANFKVKSQELRKLEKEKNDVELKINRLDINIDNMLKILSDEYTMSYEKARDFYHLDVDAEDARSKVNLYRNNIKKIGMVNLDSIEEYERVNTRYQFLLKQQGDLESAETSLLDIMNEMDGVIEEEFVKTFNEVNVEFTKVFRELFVGGNAHLELTNPSDILTTGVEIIASPPGKKLTSISLLSGGEKTLTAISLLFAILNVRTIPFCLFDEVEAALDEANVDQFGKYLNHYKDKTQFLIITHKKKTMEYAKTLYGITMQESGVSKLVSVKLNDHIDAI